MEKVAQIKWGRGKFSEVFRSTIINPSPIKPGQKVQIIWGEPKRIHSCCGMLSHRTEGFTTSGC